MKGVATEKVPGGKLIRVRVSYDDVIIVAKITGDFFLYPEEAIEDIERSLFGVRTDVDEKVIEGIISEVVRDKGAELIGITPKDIARVVKGAMK